MQAKIIANRLYIPQSTQAILWDMDGVLIDSLSLDFQICDQLLQKQFGQPITLTKAFIRSLFAYDAPRFWGYILDHVAENYAIPNPHQTLDAILVDFNQARHTAVFELNPGIAEILADARKQGLKLAVVSNNTTEEVEKVLNNSGIFDQFDKVIGNDIEKLAKKPAPDTYLFAARCLGLKPEQCVIVEDSLVGAQAGYQAGGFTIGVATGSADFKTLAQSGWTHQTYHMFEPNQLNVKFGDVRKKQIVTPNEFVTHMIEHIAWRLGVEIDFHWNNNNWQNLGEWLGTQIKQFTRRQDSASALGMIDDGSAEVSIDFSSPAKLDLESIPQLDLNWFLSLRCEQLDSGKPLTHLLQGLVEGLNANLHITVCNVEDPHHTWEGIFRAVGIVLAKVFMPAQPNFSDDTSVQENVSHGELSVLAESPSYCKVMRGTAESHVIVAVDFSQKQPNIFTFEVAPSIEVNELPKLLNLFAQAAQCSLQVEFKATVLSSSHVVMEDIGLVLGRALLEMLTLRMTQQGINGAGSSLQTLDDLEKQAIRVGISVEGRKFWSFVPFDVSYDTLKKELLIGQTVYNQLRSEDLDDFLDGLAGGLAASIMVHVKQLVAPTEAWEMVFKHLGSALHEVFATNTYRQGVPPGVKATLD